MQATEKMVIKEEIIKDGHTGGCSEDSPQRGCSEAARRMIITEAD
jgi:hypothetical protein